MEDKRYTVLFLIVREVEVEALDDIAAEVLAVRKLSPADRDGVVLDRVLHSGEEGGTDIYNDPRKAIESFARPDWDWINKAIY